MGCKRLVSIFLLSFLVCSVLPLTVRTEEPLEQSSFGNPTTPTPKNWTKFWQLFNAYSDWDLEYNQGSGWISDKPQLQIIKNYTERIEVENGTFEYFPTNKTNADSVKITLNFTASYTADYRLTFAINLDVKNYTHKESSWNYTLSYKNYTVYFDWIDIKNLPLDNVAHGIQPVGDESYFWFRIRKNNVQQDTNIVIDPTFGDSRIGGDMVSIEDYIRGSLYTCPEVGLVTKITAYVRDTGDNTNFKCAIYNHSDLSLLGTTQQVLVTANGWAWVDFTFSSPVSVINADYLLEAWADTNAGGGCTLAKNASGSANQGHRQPIAYNGFPNPLVPSHNADTHAIYATYTVAGQDLSFPLFENINVLSSISKTMELSNTLFQNVVGWSSLTMNKEKGFSLFENILIYSSVSRGIELANTLFESPQVWSSLTASIELSVLDLAFILFENTLVFPSLSRGIEIARSLSGTVNVWSSLATATEGIAQDLVFTLFETVMPLAVLISDVAEAYVLADALALAAIAFVLAIVAICLLFAFKKES